jgi:hypothetical protein
MPKYNYVTLEEIPKNVKNFYYNNYNMVDWPPGPPGNVDLVTAQDINEFLNDMNSWYELHQMNMEDFFTDV